MRLRYKFALAATTLCVVAVGVPIAMARTTPAPPSYHFLKNMNLVVSGAGRGSRGAAFIYWSQGAPHMHEWRMMSELSADGWRQVGPGFWTKDFGGYVSIRAGERSFKSPDYPADWGPEYSGIDIQLPVSRPRHEIGRLLEVLRR